MSRIGMTRRVFLKRSLAIAAVALPSRRVVSARELAPSQFSFVQMADTQLGMGGYDHDVRAFSQAVDQVNALKPDFLFICGDLVNRADERSFADFQRIKAGFQVPCHCAAGNHDVGNPPTPEKLRYYRSVIGKDYYAIEHKGWVFLVVNTELWKSTIPGESEPHDAWFRESLRTAVEKQCPVVVVGHCPPFVKSPDEKDQYYNLPQGIRQKLLELFRRSGVRAMLTGHTHRSMINNHQGIQLVTSETTSRNFDNRPLGFRIWQAGPTAELAHEFEPLVLS